MSYIRPTQTSFAHSQVSYDLGLREYMISVFRYMAIALLITGTVAFATSTSQTLMNLLFGTPLAWVVMLAPVGMAIFLSYRSQSMSLEGAQMSLMTFAALMGLSLATIFVVYTGESIARVFFITAGIFGAMSLYGYTTKTDLTSFGSFLIMGLIGIIIASLVNLFLQSSAIHFIVSLLGVFIFVGLTAYDTQKVKQLYFEVGGTGEAASKVAVFGALNLYLDFINLFIYLLQFMGSRRD